MWKTHFINANPATIMQRLYQLKAEQDGRDVIVVAHAVKRNEVSSVGASMENHQHTIAGTTKRTAAG